ncbi:MAG: hypothetical protein R2883_01935 [Caldisericia bacterium]
MLTGDGLVSLFAVGVANVKAAGASKVIQLGMAEKNMGNRQKNGCRHPDFL